MIRRILHFKRHDWQHIWWLVGRIFIGYWNGDWPQMVESWFWLRFHLENDSVLISDLRDEDQPLPGG